MKGCVQDWFFAGLSCVFFFKCGFFLSTAACQFTLARLVWLLSFIFICNNGYQEVVHEQKEVTKGIWQLSARCRCIRRNQLASQPGTREAGKQLYFEEKSTQALSHKLLLCAQADRCRSSLPRSIYLSLSLSLPVDNSDFPGNCKCRGGPALVNQMPAGSATRCILEVKNSNNRKRGLEIKHRHTDGEVITKTE